MSPPGFLNTDWRSGFADSNPSWLHGQLNVAMPNLLIDNLYSIDCTDLRETGIVKPVRLGLICWVFQVSLDSRTAVGD